MDLRHLLPADIKPQAMDFTRHMLAFNPYKRWSADWLLDHQYLAECHRPNQGISEGPGDLSWASAEKKPWRVRGKCTPPLA